MASKNDFKACEVYTCPEATRPWASLSVDPASLNTNTAEGFLGAPFSQPSEDGDHSYNRYHVLADFRIFPVSSVCLSIVCQLKIARSGDSGMGSSW